jgi:hypothetical protein
MYEGAYFPYEEPTETLTTDLVSYVDVDFDTMIIIEDERGNWKPTGESWDRHISNDDWNDYWQSEEGVNLGYGENIEGYIEELTGFSNYPVGRYQIKGHVVLAFNVEGLQYTSEYLGKDELDNPVVDTVYYPDTAKVEFNKELSRVDNFEIIPIENFDEKWENGFWGRDDFLESDDVTASKNFEGHEDYVASSFST